MKTTKENHQYFIETTYKILKELGFKYSKEELEEKNKKEEYFLFFNDKSLTKNWNLGIWAVGEWDFISKSSVDGSEYKDGYGIETYKPKALSLFLVHDWVFDKFRPSRADFGIIVEYQDDYKKATERIKKVLSNPISLYNDVDNHSYVKYFKQWYRHVGVKFMNKAVRRFNGYLCSRLFLLLAFLDKRVAYKKCEFTRDEYNNEYEIALVLKYGETEWDDWKAWKDYSSLEEKIRDFYYFKINNYKLKNFEVIISYLDEEGNLPDNIWRGIYWEEEPEKEKH